MDDQGTQTILVLLPSFISGFGNRWIGYMIICNAFFLFHHNYRLSRTIGVFYNFLALMCLNELTWCNIKIAPPSDTLYNKTNYCIHPHCIHPHPCVFVCPCTCAPFHWFNHYAYLNLAVSESQVNCLPIYLNTTLHAVLTCFCGEVFLQSFKYI